MATFVLYRLTRTLAPDFCFDATDLSALGWGNCYVSVLTYVIKNLSFREMARIYTPVQTKWNIRRIGNKGSVLTCS